MSESNSEQKPGLTSWGDIDPRGQKSDVNWLKLKSPGEYKVRLFHQPKELYRYYNEVDGKPRSALCLDPKTCPIANGDYTDKYGKPMKPKLRYAINVLNRAEPGKVFVMEAPAIVFKEFRKFWENNDHTDPGGNGGPDFIIKVSGSGLTTEYSTGYTMAAKPFTSEEKALLKEHRYNLDELFKPTDPSKIEEVLFGSRSDTAPAKTTAPAAKTAAPAKAPVAPKEEVVVSETTATESEDDMAWAQ